jgi:polysaccharide biosynthesis/export protein
MDQVICRVSSRESEARSTMTPNAIPMNGTTKDPRAGLQTPVRHHPLRAVPVFRYLAVAAVLASLSGCSTISQCVTGIPAIPAHRVPREFLGRKRTDMQEITLSRLRQNPPKVYQLAPNDVLGIYIETVLGSADMPPPVNFSLDGSKPPSLGFPVPVREDGTLALPLVEPIQVSGLTLTQATDAIRDAYTVGKRILPAGKDRIIVTLQRQREYRVLVVREESGGNGGGGGAGLILGPTKRGTGANVFLPAYENDLLSALNKTGGLPGLDAKNEILILRGNFEDGAQRDQLIARLKACQDPCECEMDIPDDVNLIRIPLRFYPEQVPMFKEQDIILQTGDIVMVQSREREQYYTGGAIAGGARPLPRDYDLDVLQAVALAGGSVASSGTGIGSGGGGGGGGGGGIGGGGGGGVRGTTPSRAIVLRKTCNGGEIPIKVDLRRALTSPSERILIQPEDTIIVQYTFAEELYNAAIQMVSFNFLLSGFSGRGI